MTPDKALCPACGAPNQCAVQAGDNSAPCWCFSAEVPAAELRARIDALPAEERNARCLCRRCAGVLDTPDAP